MGIDIVVCAEMPARGLLKRQPSAQKLLHEISSWLEDLWGDRVAWTAVGGDEQGQKTLFVSLHPTAEPMRVTIGSRGAIQASARTNTTGPGYHEFVCGLLDGMSERFGLRWHPSDDGSEVDDTSYFAHRDRARLDAEMLAWLNRLCASLLPDLRSGEATNIKVSMALEEDFEHDGAIATPMGPRDVSWVERVAADPAAGLDFFSWWDSGESAGALAGEALALMWTEVRWCEPRSEKEEGLHKRVIELLSSAYRLDPTLAYPWREWQELVNCSQPDHPMRATVEEFAMKASGPRIGYRRSNVTRRMLFDGWSMRMPGSFCEEFEGNETWVAWDGSRTIRLSTVSFRHDGHPTPDRIADDIASQMKGQIWREQANGLYRLATVEETEEDGARYHTLNGRVCGDGRVAFVTICFDDPSQEDWAIGVLKSVTPPASG